jgi:hypothetical protein
MNNDSKTTNTQGTSVPLRAIAKETGDITLYWIDELQVAGIHQRGLAKLLGCDPITIRRVIDGGTQITILQAEVVTEGGIQGVTLIQESDLPNILESINLSKAKVETRKAAMHVLKAFATAGFKLMAMLELAPQQLVAQVEQHIGAVSPKTTAEMLVVYAQQMVEQERRIQTVEAKVEQIEQRSIDAAQSLNLLPAPTETAPPLTERDSLRKLMNAWCQSNNIPHQEAWGTLDHELYIRDGFSVNARRKNSKYATNLELVAESGKLGVLYAIATEIFPRTVIG